MNKPHTSSQGKRQLTDKQRAALAAGRAKANERKKAAAAARRGVDMTGNATEPASDDDPLAPKVTTSAYKPVPAPPAAKADPVPDPTPEPASAPPARSSDASSGLEQPPTPAKQPKRSSVGAWLKNRLDLGL